jgi:hypothetical protein
MIKAVLELVSMFALDSFFITLDDTKKDMLGDLFLKS